MSVKAGKTLGYGAAPLNLVAQARVSFGATNEPARLVLDRALANMKIDGVLPPPPRLKWLVYYGPDDKEYTLNILTARQ